MPDDTNVGGNSSESRKFRKKRHTEELPPAGSPKEAFSTQIREARRAVLRKDRAQGLELLDGLAASSLTPRRRMQVTIALGESELERGDISGAVQAFQAAKAMAPEDPNGWLAPRIGLIRAFLRDANIESARESALESWSEALFWHEKTTALKAIKATDLSSGASIRIGSRPPRASVAGTRIGWLFLLEGEPALAQEYFEKAVSVNPQGGSRARHGLGLIALSQNNLSEAESRIREALLLGRFQQKTVGFWPALISARVKQGKPGVTQELLAGVREAKPPQVRARAILSIVQALREQGDADWSRIAQEWVDGEMRPVPAVVVEIRKMLLADAVRLEKPPTVLVDHLEAILSEEELGRNEYAAMAKRYVRVKLQAGKSPKLNWILSEGRRRFTDGYRFQLRHTCALALMEAGQHAEARSWLSDNINEAAADTEWWGKAHWAFARMEAFLENWSPAAASFQALFANEHVPLRFRAHAKVKWAECLLASGDTEAVLQAKDEILHILLGVNDYRVLLDAARQLTLGPPELIRIHPQIAARGVELAIHAFEAEKDPLRATSILVHLTRRMCFDFQQYREVVERYAVLESAKLPWLWSQKGDYWEYLSLVMKAFDKLDQPGKVLELAHSHLMDPATPPEGLAYIGSYYANWLILRGRAAEGLKLCDSLILEHPTHVQTAHAYYWLALRESALGNTISAKSFADRGRLALGKEPGMLWQWQLDIKFLLILSDNSAAPVIQSHKRYSPGLVNSQLAVLSNEKKLVIE